MYDIFDIWGLLVSRTGGGTGNDHYMGIVPGLVARLGRSPTGVEVADVLRGLPRGTGIEAATTAAYGSPDCSCGGDGLYCVPSRDY